MVDYEELEQRNVELMAKPYDITNNRIRNLRESIKTKLRLIKSALNNLENLYPEYERQMNKMWETRQRLSSAKQLKDYNLDFIQDGADLFRHYR